MGNLTDYIKPELLIVAVVLYFIGAWLKEIPSIKDKYIPFILSSIGIVLCTIWILASCPLTSLQNIAMAVFVAIVQGILVAGLSTYAERLFKHKTKSE